MRDRLRELGARRRLATLLVPGVMSGAAHVRKAIWVRMLVAVHELAPKHKRISFGAMTMCVLVLDLDEARGITLR